MKNIAYFLFFTGLIFTSCEGSDEVGITEYVLSSETQYIHGSSGIDTLISYYTYDEGKLVLLEMYTPNNNQPSTHEFFYDEHDRLLNSHVVSYGRFNTKFQETFYSYAYNEEGQIASQIMDSIIQYYGGPITAIIPEQEDYTYDDQLRLISIHWHNESEGSLRKFFYDDQSNLIKEEYFNNTENTEPLYIREYKSFDTHPNPFYVFMEKINIPYHEFGVSYSAHNVLEEKGINFMTSQESTNLFEYEYSTIHDLPLKIYRNDKLQYELTYETLNP